MPVAQTFTARTALAVARAEYAEMMRRAFGDADPRTARVAERAYHRGLDLLQALEATATDVALSEHAEDALQGYLDALRAADTDAAFSWLDLFPEMVRDIRRDAEVSVRVRPVGTWNAAGPRRLGRPDVGSQGAFVPASRPRRLALAA